MVGTCIDVTDRRQAQAALAESEARLTASIRAGRLAIYEFDLIKPEGKWDARAREIWGFSEDEAISVEAFMRGLHPEDRDRVREAAQAALQPTGTRRFEQEYRVINQRTGATHWVRDVSEVIFDGEIALRIHGIAQDITASKAAEQALARSEANLRLLNQKLEERVRSEVAAREEAQTRIAHLQRMEALGQLAGGIAHDFNNVMQAVQGGARLIERAPSDAERVKRLAKMVSEAAQRGASITGRLLAFSQRGDLRTGPVDSIRMLFELREVLHHTMGAGIGVVVDTPATLPSLQADKGQLETVIINLAANARDAMNGKGLITLSAVADTLQDDIVTGHGSSLKPGRYIRLSVTDRGSGMTPEVLARATEPFFTTKGLGRGTGLGLAMARGFAEQSGGGLRIESIPGCGTTISLWFPVAEEGPSPSITDTLPDKSAVAAPATVLVVDDDLLVLEVLADGLREAGYEASEAASGQDALALLRTGKVPNLIVSDLALPGMDGLELMGEVRKLHPRMPAILLTGFVTNAAEIAVGGALSGNFSLLRKPVTPDELADRVASMLEGATREG